jgi:hypothetical protein
MEDRVRFSDLAEELSIVRIALVVCDVESSEGSGLIDYHPDRNVVDFGDQICLCLERNLDVARATGLFDCNRYCL